MFPDADVDAPIVLLYLLAYTVAAAGLFLPLFSGPSADRRTKTAGRFLQIAAITGILPSLQILLDALGFTENLRGSGPVAATLAFNILIILGLKTVAVVWSELSAAFSPRPWISDSFRRGLYLTGAVIAVLNIPLQIAAMLRPGRSMLIVVEAGLITLAAMTILEIVLGTIRIYRKSSGLNSLTGLLIKLIIPTAVCFAVLSALLPDPIHLAVPPVGLIAIFTMNILIFTKQSSASENPEEARKLLFDDAGLTPREREIAMMLAEGLSYKEISEKSFVSLSTIQTHVTRIYGKMDVNSKTELSRKITG